MNDDISKNIIKIKPTTVTEQIVEQVRSMIKDGVFKPGDTLPTEMEFSVLLGVGRSSVREALKVLQAIGIIEKQPGSTAKFSKTCANSAALLFNMPNIMSEFSLIELSEARETIEVSLAGLAARNAGKVQIDKLENVQKKFEKAVADNNFDDILDLDFEFHKTIADSSGNTFLSQMLMMLHDLIIAGNERTLSRRNVQIAAEDHKRIFNSVKAANEHEAANAMKLHMDDIRNKFNFEEGETT